MNSEYTKPAWNDVLLHFLSKYGQSGCIFAYISMSTCGRGFKFDMVRVQKAMVALVLSHNIRAIFRKLVSHVT